MSKPRCRAKNPATCRTHGNLNQVSAEILAAEYKAQQTTKPAPAPVGHRMHIDPELQHKITTRMLESEQYGITDESQKLHYGIIRSFFPNHPMPHHELAHLIKLNLGNDQTIQAVRDNTTLQAALTALGLDHRTAYHAAAEATGLPLADRQAYQSYTAYARRTHAKVTSQQIIDWIRAGHKDINTRIRNSI